MSLTIVLERFCSIISFVVDSPSNGLIMLYTVNMACRGCTLNLQPREVNVHCMELTDVLCFMCHAC